MEFKYKVSKVSSGAKVSLSDSAYGDQRKITSRVAALFNRSANIREAGSVQLSVFSWDDKTTAADTANSTLAGCSSKGGSKELLSFQIRNRVNYYFWTSSVLVKFLVAFHSCPISDILRYSALVYVPLV